MVAMDVQSLGYLRITAEDPHNWAGFASHVLGMETVPGDSDVLHLRMDDRHHRIAIEPANGSGSSSYGWEVADAAALDVAAAEPRPTRAGGAISRLALVATPSGVITGRRPGFGAGESPRAVPDELTSAIDSVDPLTGMPQLSGFPVTVTALETAGGRAGGGS